LNFAWDNRKDRRNRNGQDGGKLIVHEQLGWWSLTRRVQSFRPARGGESYSGFTLSQAKIKKLTGWLISFINLHPILD
jgi:hypothetical protein